MAEMENSLHSSEAALVKGAEQEISVRCLLMPFHGINVLMPNTAVAEVIAYEEPRGIGQGPGWLKGFLSWRGRSVPVVSFEKIIGLAEGGVATHAQLIIFNSLGNSGAIPFIAMIAQGLPRLMALKDSNLHYLPGEQKSEPGVYARLLVDSNPAVVPDLEIIEKMLLQAGAREVK
jgi:chemosensory pili system protein ChpC